MRLPRASGVLLHPTSLPGPHGSGDLGREAYHFVDWLAVAGQRLWQVLPLTGIGPGNSPYMSPSAFAGNPLLVDLADLRREGWLDETDLAAVPGLEGRRVNFAAVVPFRMQRLARAAERFALSGTPAQRADFERFRADHASWLGDYSLFMALCERPGAGVGLEAGLESGSEARHETSLDWTRWEPALARREPAATAVARERHAGRVTFWEFCQWRFFRQWAALRAYANGKGVRIVGDAPIFVAHSSADVWAHPELFELDARGQPTVVAGVPPDYFSATGQRWGNPLYRWSEHAKDDYAWWAERVRRTFELVDIVRIDHFRGFAAHWEIPATEPTAMHGRWVPGPGAPLFEAISRAVGPLPIIAEDLGVITPDVDELRHRFAFPGMCILQFAFNADAGNRYLPHHHEHDSVVYTGTHDNNTTAGWWAEAPDAERHFARGYLNTDGHDMAWTLIRAAMASVADTCVHPMQDVLGLPADCRMNHPGQSTGWWEWRLQWEQVQPWHAQRLAEFGRLYGRF